MDPNRRLSSRVAFPQGCAVLLPVNPNDSLRFENNLMDFYSCAIEGFTCAHDPWSFAAHRCWCCG